MQACSGGGSHTIGGRANRERFYLVRPPHQASIGNPVALRAPHKVQRVALTAAAPFKLLAVLVTGDA
jgi:hypothetical protein